MKSKKNKADRKLLVRRQDGSIVLIVLMVMLLITIIGFVSLNSTVTEIKVAQNDRCFNQNLYRAEAAAFEAGAIHAAPGVAGFAIPFWRIIPMSAM